MQKIEENLSVVFKKHEIKLKVLSHEAP